AAPVHRRSVLMHRHVGRVIIAVLSVALIVMIGIIVLTDTNWGRNQVRRRVEALIQSNSHGVVRLGSVSGNLLNGFTAHNLVITDSSGAPFVKIDEFWASYKLSTLFGKKIDFTQV